MILSRSGNNQTVLEFVRSMIEFDGILGRVLADLFEPYIKNGVPNKYSS